VTQQSAGDVVCTSCGFVGEASLIDETAEWRSFSDKSNAVDMNRVGAPINSLLDKGGISGTSIAKGKDGRSAGFANLDRYHQQSTTVNRGVQDGFRAISHMAEKLSLGQQFINRAQEIFKKAQESKVAKGRSLDAVCGACLYIGCRLEGNPRTFNEICAATQSADKQAVSKAYKAILKKLQSELDSEGGGPGMQKQVGILSPKDYIRRLCSQLQYPNVVVLCCEKAAEQVTQRGISSSRVPISVAAAIVYFVGKMTSSPREIDQVSAVSGVSAGTIKLIANDELAPDQDKLISDAMLAKLK
jgi:transcription initiation factor TFIIB